MNEFYAQLAADGMLVIASIKLPSEQPRTYQFTGRAVGGYDSHRNRKVYKTYAEEAALEVMKRYTLDEWAALGRKIPAFGEDAFPAYVQFRSFVETGDLNPQG